MSRVGILMAKPVDWSPTPGTHVLEGKKDSCELSSDFCVCACLTLQPHRINEYLENYEGVEERVGWGRLL